MTSDRKSPFPFLKGEEGETIDQVHSLIWNLKAASEKVDQSILLFLSEKNKINYGIFKNELTTDIPMEIAALSSEGRKNVFDWIQRTYILKPDREVKENSLDDILKIAQKMLKDFEQRKKLQEGDTSEVEIDEVKVPAPMSSPGARPRSSQEPDVSSNVSVESADYEKIKAEDCTGTDGSASLSQTRENPDSSMTMKYYDAGSVIPGDDGNRSMEPEDTREKEPKANEREQPTETFKSLSSTLDQTPSFQSGFHDGQGVTNIMTQDFNPPGKVYPSLPSEIETQSESQPDNSINIMLVGGTGVGKTTFINAFQNYLKYQTLDEALTGGPFVPIRTSFDMVIEKDSKPIDICVDQSRSPAETMNEPLYPTQGQSRTQKAMIHDFPYTFNEKESTIRLIDTPGVLDTRGDVQDKKNYYATAKVIKNLTHIHAICVLLKPNESRLTPELTYALDLLLKYLPQTAIQRIVFCFTYTEPYNFCPGETLPVLEEYLRKFTERTKMTIPATKENIFCFDNNCFRFQCAVKQYPRHAVNKNDYTRTWDNNRMQLQRMLEYIHCLTPFLTADTVNIARVEMRLVKLVDTFVEISREHAKEHLELKTKKKTKYLPYKIEKITAEIEERNKNFEYVLLCVSYFTEFLYRNSIEVGDLFELQLRKLITEEEEKYAMSRTAERHALIGELKRIDDDYRKTTKDLINKTMSKEVGATTPEEIEKILSNVGNLKYYGSKVASPNSFRSTHF